MSMSIIGRPLTTRFLKITTPEVLIFRPLEPLCIIDYNNKLQCYEVVGSKSILVNAKHYLYYYEVTIPQGQGAQHVNKIFFKKTLPTTGEPQYDINSRDLIIPTPYGQISYKQQIRRGNVDVANIVITYPLTLPVFLETGAEIARQRNNNGIEVKLKLLGYSTPT
jgi:hypothetical protein